MPVNGDFISGPGLPGHYSWTFDDPLLRILLLRGIAWTANEPLKRRTAPLLEFNG